MICNECKFKTDIKFSDERGIIYNGERCGNTNCIFFKCPISGLEKSGLTRCKRFKEKTNARSIE